MNSCLWIFLFIIVFVQCRNFSKFYSFISCPLYIHLFKTSSFISSKCLLINNLFAFLKTSFVQHHVCEKWSLNYEAILDGIRSFVLANEVKINVIIWLLLCCIMTAGNFLILLVTVVSWLFNSFATDSFK